MKGGIGEYKCRQWGFRMLKKAGLRSESDQKEGEKGPSFKQINNQATIATLGGSKEDEDGFDRKPRSRSRDKRG